MFFIYSTFVNHDLAVSCLQCNLNEELATYDAILFYNKDRYLSLSKVFVKRGKIFSDWHMKRYKPILTAIKDGMCNMSTISRFYLYEVIMNISLQTPSLQYHNNFYCRKYFLFQIIKQTILYMKCPFIACTSFSLKCCVRQYQLKVETVMFPVLGIFMS